MEKIVNIWVDIINEIFIKIKNKNISLPFIIINDLRQPKIDYLHLYNNIIGNNPYSIKKFIELKLQMDDSLLNYEPFCKYFIGPFEIKTEFFTIGLKLKLDINLLSFSEKWEKIMKNPDILNKIVNNWICIVDEIFLKNKNQHFSLPLNIITEETQPIIDYDYLYHTFNKNKPFSIQEYIIFKLKSFNFDYYYEPFFKYVMIGPFLNDEEFIIIGIKNKDLYGSLNEIELYFQWKLIIDQTDILGKISYMLRFNQTKSIIHTERTINSLINYKELFNKIIERKKCSIKDYILTKISFLKSSLKYISFGKFVKDPLGTEIILFQFGIKIKNEISPRLNELSPRFLIKLNTTT